MPTYVPAKINTQYIVFVGLPSTALPGQFQANPTLAAGDAQVSIDGGAFANLGTLPAVTPAAGRAVKVTLAIAEMNGANILAILHDQTSPAEWGDVILSIQTVARQIEDLSFPNTSGRGTDVSVGGEVGLDWANIGSPTTAQNLSATNIDVDQVVASVSGAVASVTGAVGSVTGNVGGNVTGSVGSVVGAVGSVTGAVGSVTGNVGGNVVGSVASVTALSAAAIQSIWDALTAALTTVGSIGKRLADNIDATISSRLASASYTAPPTAIQNADALLVRDLTAVAAPAARSPMNALRKLMNRVGLAAPTLTVYAEDDATPAYTQTVTQDAAQTPIKELDTV